MVCWNNIAPPYSSILLWTFKTTSLLDSVPLLLLFLTAARGSTVYQSISLVLQHFPLSSIFLWAFKTTFLLDQDASHFMATSLLSLWSWHSKEEGWR